jgi:hypothetical protein
MHCDCDKVQFIENFILMFPDKIRKTENPKNTLTSFFHNGAYHLRIENKNGKPHYFSQGDI